MNQTDPDRLLVREMATGNAGALRSLYSRHGGRILNYLDGLLQDPQLAEEVLQDVMLAAWNAASDFRGECKVRTWLFAMARNHAINASRSRQIAIVALNEDVISDNTDRLRQIELQDTLEGAFDQMSRQQCEVLELKFFHGFTMAEIAEVLDIPLGTVQSRLHKAKQQLRRLLQTEGFNYAR